MLAENESLFVEHKKDIAKGQGFQLAKASASLANTMGGWILIGVIGSGIDPAWTPPPGEFVDAVRQRLEGQVDPLPSFAAAVMQVDGLSVGVVRVYESSDTPHILSDGSIVVREPAQDAKLRKRGRYEATPIRSHYELLQLAQRGRAARDAAESRFAERSLPFVESMTGLSYTANNSGGVATRRLIASGPSLVLRLAPLTLTQRWRDWAVSERTTQALSAATERLAGPGASKATIVPHPQGFGARSNGSRREVWTPGASISVTRMSTAVADAGGALALSLSFTLIEGSGLTRFHRPVDEEGLAELLLPLVQAATAVLASGEHLGRYVAHVLFLRMNRLFLRDPSQPGADNAPEVVPAGGDVTIGSADAATSAAEIRQLARSWARTYCRSSGMLVFG